jgi:hypothetical protein
MPGMKPTMDEWKAGTLHSGSKTGPVVKSQKQAIAIGLSEARKAGANIPKPKKAPAYTGPTKPTRKTGPPLFTPKLKQPKPSGLY